MPKAPVAHVDIPVVFAGDADAARLGPRPMVAVLPDADNWNDHGYRIFARLLVLTDAGETLLPIRFMFQGENHTDLAIARAVALHGPLAPVEAAGAGFCSLQASDETYGQLVALLGFDATVAALRRLRDVVLAGIEDDEPVVALGRSDAFQVAGVRNATRYAAYRRGGRYLRPSPPPQAEDAATSFVVSAALPSSSEPVSVDLDFAPDPLFQDRSCVLIGRNGVGKTQLLKAMIDGMTRMEPALPARADAPRLEPSPSISRTIVFSSVPSDPYPKSIPPWFEIDYAYFGLLGGTAPLGADFIAAILDCMRDDGARFGGAPGELRRDRLMSTLLDGLGMWDGLHLPVRPDIDARQFRTVRDIDGDLFVCLEQGFSEKRESHLVAGVDFGRSAVMLGPDATPRRLSSGEVAMAHFVAQAVSAVENGSLLLFDEPETHLHPNYVSHFMDILQELLDRTRSVAIVATHSAYVLREVPRQRVRVLQREGTSVVVGTPRLQTFGAGIDDLSQAVFLDGQISPRYRKRLAEWSRSRAGEMDIEMVLERYGDQLNPATLSLIARGIRGDA